MIKKRWGLFFFFFAFHFWKWQKFVLGLPKWEFSTGKQHFTLGKKIRKNDFAPSQKYACYAPVYYWCRLYCPCNFAADYCQGCSHLVGHGRGQTAPTLKLRTEEKNLEGKEGVKDEKKRETRKRKEGERRKKEGKEKKKREEKGEERKKEKEGKERKKRKGTVLMEIWTLIMIRIFYSPNCTNSVWKFQKLGASERAHPPSDTPLCGASVHLVLMRHRETSPDLAPQDS